MKAEEIRILKASERWTPEVSEEANSVSFTLELLLHADLTPEGLILWLLRTAQDGDKPISSYFASRNLLENEVQAQAWVTRTRELFFKEIGPVLLNNLGLLFMVVGNRALIETGLAPFDKKGILNTYISLTEKLMRERLGIEAGRPSKWATQDLSQAILDAMLTLKAGQRTYDRVAKKLQETHPDRAPKNGESLRKTVCHLSIDWMTIKKMAKKRS